MNRKPEDVLHKQEIQMTNIMGQKNMLKLISNQRTANQQYFEVK